MRRVLLKLSGEFLAGSQGFGVTPDATMSLAQEIAAALSRRLRESVCRSAGMTVNQARRAARRDRVQPSLYRLSTSVPFVPPKPNELETA